MIDIGLKRGFRVWYYPVWRGIAHVLIVVAPVGAIGAVPIDKPSAVESAALPQVNVMAKLPDSGLNTGVARDENFVYVLQPTRQEGKKLAVNGSAEGSAGSSTANLVVVAPLDVTNKGSQQQSANDGVGIIKEGFDHWWWIYVAIALSPLFMSGGNAGGMKHNVKVRGGAAVPLE